MEASIQAANIGPVRIESDSPDIKLTPEGLIGGDGHRLHGFVVRQFLAPADTKVILKRLLDGPMPAFQEQGPGIHVIGPNLQPPGAESDAYFEAVPQWDEFFLPLTSELPSQNDGLERRVRNRLRSLAQNRVVARPVHNGHRYSFGAVRFYLPGSFIPPHAHEVWYETWYANMALKEQLVPSLELSFLLTLRTSEAGGNLRLYNYFAPLEWTDAAAEAGFIEPELNDGDLIIFESSRVYHEITPVHGRFSRITLGLWISLSRDGKTVLTWT